MFEKLGGRKMVGATLTMAIGILAVVIKGDIPDNLLQLLEVVFGVFAGANSLNTAVALVKSKTPGAPAAGTIPADHAVQAFVELSGAVQAGSAEANNKLDAIMKSAQLTQNALSVIAEKVLSK